jgi:hypothetical protein
VRDFNQILDDARVCRFFSPAAQQKSHFISDDIGTSGFCRHADEKCALKRATAFL